jgi:hypothetical protein
MAGDSDAPPTDMKAHVQTYDGVISLLKWGAAAAFIVAALVIWLLY